MKRWLWLAGGACAIACTSSNNTSTTDAGANDAAADAAVDAAPDGASDASSEGGQCNSLVNVAQDVQGMYVAQDPPAPTGGSIADGTWVLTQISLYTGADGGTTGAIPDDTLELTTVIAGGAYQQVFVSNGQPEARTAGTWATNGTAMDVEQSCPTQTGTAFKFFSADGTTAKIYNPDAKGGTLEWVLVKH